MKYQLWKVTGIKTRSVKVEFAGDHESVRDAINMARSLGYGRYHVCNQEGDVAICRFLKKKRRRREEKNTDESGKP